MPFIVQLVLGIALSLGSQLLSSAFAQDKKQQIGGLRGTAQVGGDNPLAFIMGFFATAGKLEYAGTWGQVGDTPNAYLTKVYSLSDLPVRGFGGVFIDGVRVTLDATAHPDFGYPVLEYRENGVDHLWVKFHKGDQTVADPLLLSAFGGAPERPWQSDMVGIGVAYAIVTALWERNLFNGEPAPLFEVHGIPLDDPRGDNAHENPIVAIDNILHGIRYAGTWIYGPQNISDARLPSANWQAQMDKCDAPIALDGGGTEPRFRFGLEVLVDQEPHAVIGELLKACEGRIAEIGGTYKVLVGEPDAPVVTFTDESVVISEGQTFDPFPGLEETYNAITAIYPEPLEAWENKEAPPRYRSDLELLDDNRRLPFSTSYKAVSSPTQVQRLMRAAIEETRRFRKHSMTMPPNWWEFEPLDVAEWNSEKNGYETKSGLITVMDDLPNGNQVIGWQEIDPADYDWSTAFELPFDVAPLTFGRPVPQEVTGFYVTPAVIEDNDGNSRRPAIDVHWDGDKVDVRTIKITIRLDDGDAPVWEGRPVNFADGVLRVGQNLLPNTVYEVQGEYEPFSARATEKTAWLPVTTPDIRTSIDDLNADFRSVIGILTGDGTGSLTDNLRAIRERIAQQANLGTAEAIERNLLREELVAETGDIRAYFLHEVSVLVTADMAIATELTELTAEVGDNAASIISFNQASVNRDQALTTSLNLLTSNYNSFTASVATQFTTLANADSALATLINEVAVEADGATASGLIKMQAVAAPSGVSVRVAILARRNTTTSFVETGLLIDIFADGSTRVGIKAEQFAIFSVSNSGIIRTPFSIDGPSGKVKMTGDVLIDGNLSVLGNTMYTYHINSENVTQFRRGTAGGNNLGESPLHSEMVNRTYTPKKNGGVQVTAYAKLTNIGSGVTDMNLQLRRNGVVVNTGSYVVDDVPSTQAILFYNSEHDGNPTAADTNPVTYSLWARNLGGDIVEVSQKTIDILHGSV